MSELSRMAVNQAHLSLMGIPEKTFIPYILDYYSIALCFKNSATHIVTAMHYYKLNDAYLQTFQQRK